MAKKKTGRKGASPRGLKKKAGTKKKMGKKGRRQQEAEDDPNVVPGPPPPDPGATRLARLPPENSAEEIRQKSEASGPLFLPPGDADERARQKLARSKRHDTEGQIALDTTGNGDYAIQDVDGDSPTRAREHHVSINGKLYEHVGFHEGLWAYR